VRLHAGRASLVSGLVLWNRGQRGSYRSWRAALGSVGQTDATVVAWVNP
jgi:hypothetical protein